MQLENLKHDLSRFCDNPAVKRLGAPIGLMGLSLLSVLTSYASENNLYPQVATLTQKGDSTGNGKKDIRTPSQIPFISEIAYSKINSPSTQPEITTITEAESKTLPFTPHIMQIMHGPDKDYIYNTKTGKIVSPRGHNFTPVYWDKEIPPNEVGYTHPPVPGGHVFAHPDFFSEVEMESIMAKMHAYKADPSDDAWMRVFINPYIICGEDGKLSQPVLKNVDTTLRLAKKYNIFLDLTLNQIPMPCYVPQTLPEDFENENALLMSKEGVDLRMKYMRDFLLGLRQLGSPTEYIGIISQENEWNAVEDLKPLSKTSGIVTPANGQQYDMGKPADKKRILDESLIYISIRGKGTLLPIDPTLIYGMAYFAPSAVEGPDNRVIYTAKAFSDRYGSKNDVHLPHRYEGMGKTAQEEVRSFLEGQADSFNQITRKPIIWEEYGVFKDAGGFAPGIKDERMATLELVRDQAQSCNMVERGIVVANVTGWFVWGLGLPVKPPYITTWSPEEGDELMYKYTSPKFRPDPCSVETVSSAPKLIAPFRKLIPILQN